MMGMVEVVVGTLVVVTTVVTGTRDNAVMYTQGWLGAVVQELIALTFMRYVPGPGSCSR